VVLPVTVSIGVAALDPAGPMGGAMKSPAHLVMAADLAAYAAKHAGRNCVRVFSVTNAAPAGVARAGAAPAVPTAALKGR
jgi:hypothetical protein